MSRHRRAYNQNNSNPYELSRGRVEQLIQCEGYFCLRQAKGIALPSIPGFNLNTNTDALLKRDVDKYRGKARLMRGLRIFVLMTMRTWINGS